MKRRTFDSILSLGGVVLTIVLVVAGALLMWGASFANSNVHDQLAKQQITFPALGSKSLASPEIGPYLNQYAGQPLTTGAQAEAYANHFISVHLSEMPFGGVYSKASAAAQADPTNTKLAGQVDTIFRGTTLRGLLLEAYAFSVFGQIAFWSGIAAFALAGVMLVLTLLGFMHLRGVRPEDEILVSEHPLRELVGMH